MQDLGILFSGEEELFVSAAENESAIRVFNLNNGGLTNKQFIGHGLTVNAMALSENGEILAAGSEYGEVLVWHTESAHLLTDEVLSTGDTINDIAITSDGSNIYTAHNSGKVIQWSRLKNSLSLINMISAHLDGAFALAMLERRHKLLLTGGVGGILRFWDMHALPPLQLSALPDKKFFKYFNYDSHTQKILGFHQGKIAVWHPETSSWNEFSVAISGELLDVTRDAKYLLIRQDYNDINQDIVIWNVDEVSPEYILKNNEKRLICGHFSPDVTMVIVCLFGDNPEFIVWKLDTGYSNKTILNTSSRTYQRVAFSENSMFLAASADDHLTVWETKNFTILQDIEIPVGGYVSLTIDPTNQFIVTGDLQGNITVRPLNNLKQVLYNLKAHNSSIRTIVFYPQSRDFLSADDTRNIVLWDGNLMEPVGSLSVGKDNFIENIKFIYGLYHIAVSIRGKGIFTYTLDPEEWAEKAKSIANRDFSAGEEQQFLN